jgi:hypothetical protein
VNKDLLTEKLKGSKTKREKRIRHGRVLRVATQRNGKGTIEQESKAGMQARKDVFKDKRCGKIRQMRYKSRARKYIKKRLSRRQWRRNDVR